MHDNPSSRQRRAGDVVAKECQAPPLQEDVQTKFHAFSSYRLKPICISILGLNLAAVVSGKAFFIRAFVANIPAKRTVGFEQSKAPAFCRGIIDLLAGEKSC